MITIYNIRGTNGSGKTTLARHFLPPNLQGDLNGGPVDLLQWKTKADKLRWVEGYIDARRRVLVVGSYKNASGGMDNIRNFEDAQNAIEKGVRKFGKDIDNIVCEGILASTVYGSWGAFAKKAEAHGVGFAFVYLQTPLEVCIARIKQRQIDKKGVTTPIKEDLVADKIKAIAATRLKAISEAHPVFDLPFGNEINAMEAIMAGTGSQYIAKP